MGACIFFFSFPFLFPGVACKSYVVPGKSCIIRLVFTMEGGREGSVAKVFITHQWRSFCLVVWAGRIMLIITIHKLNAIPPSNLGVAVFWGVDERLRTGVLFRRVQYCTILWAFTSFHTPNCPCHRRRRQNPRGYSIIILQVSYEYYRA